MGMRVSNDPNVATCHLPSPSADAVPARTGGTRPQKWGYNMRASSEEWLRECLMRDSLLSVRSMLIRRLFFQVPSCIGSFNKNNAIFKVVVGKDVPSC